MIFVALLNAAQLSASAISGYGDAEYSQTAVTGLVAIGQVDAAFADEHSANAMGMTFAPLVAERFYLVAPGDASSALRQALDSFCGVYAGAIDGVKKADEYTPTRAVLKRIHKAGFWKTGAENS